jgi:hypothetical protein
LSEEGVSIKTNYPITSGEKFSIEFSGPKANTDCSGRMIDILTSEFSNAARTVLAKIT